MIPHVLVVIVENKLLVLLCYLCFGEAIWLEDVADIYYVGVDLEIKDLLVGLTSYQLTT